MEEEIQANEKALQGRESDSNLAGLFLYFLFPSSERNRNLLG